MKSDLNSAAVPPTLATANAVLTDHLTALAANVDAASAQIIQRGDSFGGAACCFLTGPENENSFYVTEAADAKAITG